MLSLPPALQCEFDERVRRRGRLGARAEAGDVLGGGQIVPESVGAQQHPTGALGGDRLHAGLRPRLRVGVGAEPAGQRVGAALHGLRVGRGARGDQFLGQGVVDRQLLRRRGRFGNPVRPAVADVADRDLHRPFGSGDERGRGVRARRRDGPLGSRPRCGRRLRRVGQPRQHDGASAACRGECGQHRVDARLRRRHRGGLRIAGGRHAVAHGNGDGVRPAGVAVDHHARRGGVLVAGVFDSAVGDHHDPAEIRLVAVGFGAPMTARRCSTRRRMSRCRSPNTAPRRSVPAAGWRRGGSPTTRRRSSRRTGRRYRRSCRTAGTSPGGRSYPCPRPNRICLLHQVDPLPHVGHLVRQLAVAVFHPGSDAGLVEIGAEEPRGLGRVPRLQPPQRRAEHPQPDRRPLGRRLQGQRRRAPARVEQRLLVEALRRPGLRGGSRSPPCPPP